jgi:hypothetical protein
MTPDQAMDHDRRVAQERLAEARRAVAEYLVRAKGSGIVRAVEVLVTSEACRACPARRGLVIPIEDCTPGMLPPYPDCELRSGCEACFAEVLEPRGRG